MLYFIWYRIREKIDTSKLRGGGTEIETNLGRKMN